MIYESYNMTYHLLQTITRQNHWIITESSIIRLCHTHSECIFGFFIFKISAKTNRFWVIHNLWTIKYETLILTGFSCIRCIESHCCNICDWSDHTKCIHTICIFTNWMAKETISHPLGILIIFIFQFDQDIERDKYTSNSFSRAHLEFLSP